MGQNTRTPSLFQRGDKLTRSSDNACWELLRQCLQGRFLSSSLSDDGFALTNPGGLETDSKFFRTIPYLFKFAVREAKLDEPAVSANCRFRKHNDGLRFQPAWSREGEGYFSDQLNELARTTRFARWSVHKNPRGRMPRPKCTMIQDDLTVSDLYHSQN